MQTVGLMDLQAVVATVPTLHLYARKQKTVSGRTHEAALLQLRGIAAVLKIIAAVPVYRIYWLSQADSDQVLAE